jgi:hypothetical protein
MHTSIPTTTSKPGDSRGAARFTLLGNQMSGAPVTPPRSMTSFKRPHPANALAAILLSKWWLTQRQLLVMCQPQLGVPVRAMIKTRIGFRDSWFAGIIGVCAVLCSSLNYAD